MSDNTEQSGAHESPLNDELPVCHNCLETFSRHDHYCQNCGATVGQCTAYMPFVNIQFFANFFGRLWQRTWFEKGVSLPTRLFSLVLIVLLAPFMLVGLPFVLFRKLR